MVIVLLLILGLCFGSFINALVWRIHEQAKGGKSSRAASDLSIVRGRSVCPHCRHRLAARDLIPLVSWFMLKGKCRYCKSPISVQYFFVELLTATLFTFSYIFWPSSLHGVHLATFTLWLILLVGFIALAVYDICWQLLPNRIIYPLAAVAVIYGTINVTTASSPLTVLLDIVLGVLVGGGIFYVLFQLSDGKWIGGGDVKLGWLLGLIAGSASRSLLLLFLAAICGTLFSLPLLITNRLHKTSKIPFGPFLILAIIIVELFGTGILTWYEQAFIHI